MHQIIIQRAVKHVFSPNASELRRFAKTAINKISKKTPSSDKAIEMTLRIVDREEMTRLNETYRQKNKPTNVLAFPSHIPADIILPVKPIGDVVICAEVVNDEALSQAEGYRLQRWAHMVVHGICHLFGYDHHNDHDAEIMERLEGDIMLELGFKNPYESI